MAVIKWYLNFVWGNFGMKSLVISNPTRAADACPILKSRVWFWDQVDLNLWFDRRPWLLFSLKSRRICTEPRSSVLNVSQSTIHRKWKTECFGVCTRGDLNSIRQGESVDSQFAVSVSQKVIGDTATIGKFRAKITRSQPIEWFIYHCCFSDLFLSVKFSPAKFIDKRVGIGVKACPY